jgi:bifunctional non-homologous end joining protein LigD
VKKPSAKPRTLKRTTAAKLRTYRAKRDFTRTAEPPPEAAPSERAALEKGRLRFMVHKHDASHLHYDVRLEVDGVLASWAVPKGPSLDPSVKRLAVETEDHPLAYATFEGRIPDDAYGGGDSLIWESGWYETVPPGQETSQRAAGRMTVELHGQKLRGRWHLVRTRLAGSKQQWLLFKARDAFASDTRDIVAERPESVKTGRVETRGAVKSRDAVAIGPRTPVPGHWAPGKLLDHVWPPMLARLSNPEEAGGMGPLVFEVKYDGFRALAGLSGGRLAFRSRSGGDLRERFPSIASAMACLKVEEAVLDGEVVALDPQGRSRFQLLQNVLRDPRLDLRYVVFDLLWHDGEDLRGRPLEERRARLEKVLGKACMPLQLSERIALPMDRALAEARRRGWEGLIAKREGSAYQGARSTDWLKLKVLGGQEVVLLGYLPITNGKPQIGSLIIGVHGPDGYREVGKVGTGYTAQVRAELKRLLDRDRVDAPAAADARPWPGAVWVRPRLVANVAFTEWTADGRLRHPVFQGLRDDKRPEDVVREAPARTRSGTGRKTQETGDMPTTRLEGGKERPRLRAAARLARAPAVKTAAAKKAAAKKTAAKKSAVTAPAAKKAAAKRTAAADARTVATPVPGTGKPPRDVGGMLTHPERVLFPADGLTKADVFAYYREVAPLLVPVLRGRPLAVQQWPGGIEAPGFFRHQMAGTPPWVPTLLVEHEDKTLRHVDVQREEVLLWLANQSALTLHAWGSHGERLDTPDWVAFDLDPGEGGWKSVLQVAAVLRDKLEALGLESMPKTSGKRGLHVLVPLAPGHTWAQALSFAEALGADIVRELPDLATMERSIAKRKGRLYVDTGQNVRGKTVVAPYSLRAVDGAPFSAPLTWAEVNARLSPARFTLTTLRQRLDKVGDLFAPVCRLRQKLPGLV